ncbi:hypothetical protein ACWGN5_38430 [Streptomyces sp. NPDC055815]
MSESTAKAPADYGPQQFPDHLGFELWRFERALERGLIPPPDVAGRRWSAALVDAAAARAEEIRTATGTLPDMGATRAAELLADRLGVPADADTVAELARAGLIPRTGSYKGHTLYDGLALEQFTDRAALERAHRDGRLLDRYTAARHLGVRDVDFGHLTRSGRLRPAARVRSRYQPRSSAPAVALFRRGDLDALLADPTIDWNAVRATRKGRPSPLARLASPTKAP